MRVASISDHARVGVWIVAISSVWSAWGTAAEVGSRAVGGPAVSADAVLVLHNRTGDVLIARSANEVRSIASLTKLMAALVVRGRGLQLDQGTTLTRNDYQVALGGCRTRLELNWTYSNRDLLHAALMASDNRAVSAMARAVNLSPNALVQAMNELAHEMGLRHTRLSGPVGINPDNVSTAWDLSRIVRRASQDATLSAIMAKQSYQVKPLRGYRRVSYRNTNPLVGKSAGAKFIASKTGYNKQAGYCIAAVVALRKVGEVTVVLLGSNTKQGRVRDLKAVLRWVRHHARQKGRLSSAAIPALVGPGGPSSPCPAPRAKKTTLSDMISVACRF